MISKSKGITLNFISYNFIYASILWMLLAYLPIYLKQLHIPDGGIGILISIFSATMLLIAVPFGYLSDKFSPRRLVQFGISLFLIAMVGLCFIKNFSGISLLLLIGGSGSAISLISIYSLYYKNLGIQNRGKEFGLFLLAAHFGYSFGPLAGGYILSHFNKMSYLFIFAIFLLILLLAISTKLKDANPIRFAIREYKDDLARKEVLYLILIVLVMGIHFGAERTSFSLFLRENVGLANYQIGQIFFYVGIWIGIIALISGHIFDRKRNIIALLSIGLLLSGTFQVLTSMVSSFRSVLPVRLLHTAGDSFVILSYGLMVSLIFTRQRVGGNYGFIRTVMTCGIFFGAIISGFLARQFGYGNPFIFSGILLMALSLFLWQKRGLINQLLKLNTVKEVDYGKDQG